MRLQSFIPDLLATFRDDRCCRRWLSRRRDRRSCSRVDRSCAAKSATGSNGSRAPVDGPRQQTPGRPRVRPNVGAQGGGVQAAPVQQIHLPRMHGFLLDLLDAHRRRSGSDDPQHHQVLFAIARRHRRPLCQQKLFGAQQVLSRAVIGHRRSGPCFMNNPHTLTQICQATWIGTTLSGLSHAWLTGRFSRACGTPQCAARAAS